MQQRREYPYIWATWLPRLLTGENSCEWAVWFKAHHQNWERVPSDFDQAKWMLDHTALLNERIANWTAGGYDVDIEAQNRFELHGRTATFAGRPDIIARREDHAVIVDAKTGHDSPSHAVQVMIYLYAIPSALERYRSVKLRGQVTYRDHTTRISAEAVDDKFIQNLARSSAASRVKSPQDECRAARNAGSATSAPPTVQCVWTVDMNRKGDHHRLLIAELPSLQLQEARGTIITAQPN